MLPVGGLLMGRALPKIRKGAARVPCPGLSAGLLPACCRESGPGQETDALVRCIRLARALLGLARQVDLTGVAGLEDAAVWQLARACRWLKEVNGVKWRDEGMKRRDGDGGMPERDLNATESQ